MQIPPTPPDLAAAGKGKGKGSMNMAAHRTPYPNAGRDLAENHKRKAGGVFTEGPHRDGVSPAATFPRKMFEFVILKPLAVN